MMLEREAMPYMGHSPKRKKPFYKRWWFIALSILIGLSVAGKLIGDVSRPVPSVIGMNLEDARKKLSDDGFKDIEILPAKDKIDEESNWDVSEQHPSANKKVSSNTKIQLTVNRDRVNKLEKAKKEEAERKAKEEAERKAKEEAERKAREEAERRTKEEQAVVNNISSENNVYYSNCAAVRAAGKAPLYRGSPGYRSGLDRDGDGIACE